MVKLSQHTLLINQMMGLAVGVQFWPCPLKDLKYDVGLIEAHFSNSKGESVNPDLILVSRKQNHGMVIDCKSKTVEEDQINRYKNTHATDLVEKGKVNVPDPPNFKSDTAFFSNKIELKDNPLLKDYFAVMITSEKSIDRYNKEFCNRNLNKIFPIKIEQNHKPPTELYPFSMEPADIHVFASYLLRAIVLRAMDGEYENPTDEILETCHPYWKSIEDREKKRFRKEADIILNALARSDELHGLLTKIGTKKDTIWKVPHTLNAIKDRFEDMANNLPEHILDDF